MADNGNGIVPVMPMGGSDFGSNSFMWIFGLLILMGLFNGGGFGNYNNGAAAALGFENLATSNEVQRSFDNQNLQAQTRDILAAVNSGTAQAVAATNQTFHDTVNALSDKYSELARDIAGLAVGQANQLAKQQECCCETKQLILEKSANTDAQVAQNKYDLSMQMAQMEARLSSKMDANEIQNLRDQVQQLQLAQATSGMLKFPNNWSYGAGPFPPIFGNCGCCGN